MDDCHHGPACGTSINDHRSIACTSTSCKKRMSSIHWFTPCTRLFLCLTANLFIQQTDSEVVFVSSSRFMSNLEHDVTIDLEIIDSISFLATVLDLSTTRRVWDSRRMVPTHAASTSRDSRS